jgi:hypothetical protein
MISDHSYISNQFPHNRSYTSDKFLYNRSYNGNISNTSNIIKSNSNSDKIYYNILYNSNILTPNIIVQKPHHLSHQLIDITELSSIPSNTNICNLYL